MWADRARLLCLYYRWNCKAVNLSQLSTALTNNTAALDSHGALLDTANHNPIRQAKAELIATSAK